MSMINHPSFLRIVLRIDAATCVATGLLMSVGCGVVASLTQISSGLLISAGLSLFPIAAFIAFVALRSPLWSVGVWLVIVGNIGNSLLLLSPAVHVGCRPRAAEERAHGKSVVICKSPMEIAVLARALLMAVVVLLLLGCTDNQRLHGDSGFPEAQRTPAPPRADRVQLVEWASHLCPPRFATISPKAPLLLCRRTARATATP